jgi:hypothetical protein
MRVMMAIKTTSYRPCRALAVAVLLAIIFLGQPIAAWSSDTEDLVIFEQQLPQQKGKEAQIFGSLDKSKPTEGFYFCKYADFAEDGQSKTYDQIESDEAHSGFDLFADGTTRLFNKKTNKYEEGGDDWQHNTKTGATYFSNGTLNVYFKFPIHVRKNASANTPTLSLLYSSQYHLDGSPSNFTTCFNIGPTKSKSPKVVIAERAGSELTPPPPGSTRIAGLYWNQKWTTRIGFAGVGEVASTYQQDDYSYRYFQDNGYVWIGEPPPDGDFEKLGCTKPMVNDKGEASCTTYDIRVGWFSKGEIRIGIAPAIAYANDDTALTLGQDTYSLVKPQSHLTINQKVSYFHSNGLLTSAGEIDFKSNGSYTTNRQSAVFSVNEIGDTQTTVSAVNADETLTGAYDIDGYSIVFKPNNGPATRKFFAVLGDGFYMLGNQPYTDKKM